MHRTVKPIIQIITSTLNVIAHDQLVLAISDDDSKPTALNGVSTSSRR
jgi:hypothetical protein